MRFRFIQYSVLFLLLFYTALQPLMARPVRTGHDRLRHDLNGLLSGINSSNHILLGGYADVSYSQITHSFKEFATQPIGYSFSGGMLFEYQHYYLKLQTGIGCRFQDVSTHVGTFSIYDNVVDAMGYPYQLRYEFKDRHDISRYTHLQIPLLVGTAYKYFYAMAGCKLNLTLKSQNNITAICSTSAKYDQFSGIFEEMDNHGLRKDVPISSTGNILPRKFDLLASVECGIELAASEKGYLDRRVYKVYDNIGYRVRIALFCDVGMISMVAPTVYKLVEIPSNYKWDFSQFKMNHVLSSEKMHDVPLHNVYVGIKFSAFLDITRHGVCRICGDDSEIPLWSQY